MTNSIVVRLIDGDRPVTVKLEGRTDLPGKMGVSDWAEIPSLSYRLGRHGDESPPMTVYANQRVVIEERSDELLDPPAAEPEPEPEQPEPEPNLPQSPA
jgi:hypothetical protein